MSDKRIEDFNIESGVINSVFWGIEPDRLILTSFINLSFDGGSGQGFGGYAFDSYDKDLKKRIPGKENEIAQNTLLKVFNVSTLDELNGKKIYAISNWGEVLAISPYHEFNFYSFLSFFKDFNSNQFVVDMIEKLNSHQIFKCPEVQQENLINLKNIFVEKQHLESVIENKKNSSNYMKI